MNHCDSAMLETAIEVNLIVVYENGDYGQVFTFIFVISSTSWKCRHISMGYLFKGAEFNGL